METDRLKEEKERGLSIVPGFAFIESEGGVIDFIDVPGHEDFIRMMISGATGIDYLLLTVAANEGIKPQTQEHFNIAGLLGLDKGLVVITKSDLVTRADCDRVRDEIRDFTAGTFMQGAQITETSISDGDSINNLTMLLEKQLLNPRREKRYRTVLPAAGPGVYHARFRHRRNRHLEERHAVKRPGGRDHAARHPCPYTSTASP